MTTDPLAATRSQPYAVVAPELGLVGAAEGAAVADPGFDLGAGEMVATTGSFVVTPRVFPGGDIGELAVNGTVNEVAVRGTRPVAVCVAYLVEEGLDVRELRAVTASVARAADAAGVRVVSADVTMVGKDAADGLLLTTTGLGVPLPDAHISATHARPDDVVLISGPIGLHGTAVLGARAGLDFGAEIASDTRPLHDLVAAMVEAGGKDIHVLHAPARGGLAGAVTETAEASAVGVELDEAAIPVPGPVAAACDVLGLDPLHAANAGCLVAFVAPDAALEVLAAMRAHPAGAQARPIGRTVPYLPPAPEAGSPLEPGRVRMHTPSGVTRAVLSLAGDRPPRVC